MVVHPNLQMERVAWKKIHDAAAALSRSLGKPLLQEPSQYALDTSIPELDLPFPHHILEPLSTLAMPENTRQALINSFARHISLLQQEYATIYRRAYAALSSSRLNPEKLKQVYQSLYQRHCFPMVQSQMHTVSQKLRDRLQPRPTSEKKSSFNTQYTPLLEAYFERNAYPSTADRLVLAQKTMMSPRQIEVWFQNHRNRATKRGKVLKRLNCEALPFDSLSQHQTLTRVLEAPEERDRTICANASSPTSGDAFSVERPPHAFPTAFPPPTCVDDPFPNQDGIFKISPPVWTRHPTTFRAVTPVITVDELSDLFSSKMHFREGARAQPIRKAQPTTFPLPWFSSRITIPFSAPIPFLVPRSSRSSTLTAMPRKSIRPTDVRNMPDWTSYTPSPRKAAPFPLRMPCGQQHSQRASSHMTPSRSSSLSSIDSSCSRTSSYSSTSSPPPQTPRQESLDPYSDFSHSNFSLVEQQFDVFNPLLHPDSSSNSTSTSFEYLDLFNTFDKQNPLISSYELSSLLMFHPSNYAHVLP